MLYEVITLVLTGGGLTFVYSGALADQVQEFVNPERPRSTLGRWARKTTDEAATFTPSEIRNSSMPMKNST